MCNHLGTVPACDRLTDILPWHSPRYAWHRAVKMNPIDLAVVYGQ